MNQNLCSYTLTCQNLFCTISHLYCLFPMGWMLCSFKLQSWQKCLYCNETTLTGESRFHINPQGIWTWVPCDGKQTGSSLDQWDMVRKKWDCRLSTGLPPAADSVGCEARRDTCNERETRTGKLCEIKWDYHIVGTRPSDGSGRSPP